MYNNKNKESLGQNIHYKIVSSPSTNSLLWYKNPSIILPILVCVLSLLITRLLTSESTTQLTEECPEYKNPVKIPNNYQLLLKLATGNICADVVNFVSELPITLLWWNKAPKNLRLELSEKGAFKHVPVEPENAITHKTDVESFQKLKDLLISLLKNRELPTNGPIRPLSCEPRVNIGKYPLSLNKQPIFVSGIFILDPIFMVEEVLSIVLCDGERMGTGVSGTFSPKRLEAILIEPKELGRDTYSDLMFIERGKVIRSFDFWGNEVTENIPETNFHTLQFTIVEIQSNGNKVQDIQILTSSEDVLKFKANTDAYRRFNLQEWDSFTQISDLINTVKQVDVITVEST